MLWVLLWMYIFSAVITFCLSIRSESEKGWLSLGDVVSHLTAAILIGWLLWFEMLFLLIRSDRTVWRKRK